MCKWCSQFPAGERERECDYRCTLTPNVEKFMCPHHAGSVHKQLPATKSKRKGIRINNAFSFDVVCALVRAFLRLVSFALLCFGLRCIFMMVFLLAIATFHWIAFLKLNSEARDQPFWFFLFLFQFSSISGANWRVCECAMVCWRKIECVRARLQLFRSEKPFGSTENLLCDTIIHGISSHLSCCHCLCTEKRQSTNNQSTATTTIPTAIRHQCAQWKCESASR